MLQIGNFTGGDFHRYYGALANPAAEYHLSPMPFGDSAHQS
jgi:hypothetical protein